MFSGFSLDGCIRNWVQPLRQAACMGRQTASPREKLPPFVPCPGEGLLV